MSSGKGRKYARNFGKAGKLPRYDNLDSGPFYETKKSKLYGPAAIIGNPSQKNGEPEPVIAAFGYCLGLSPIEGDNRICVHFSSQKPCAVMNLSTAYMWRPEINYVHFHRPTGFASFNNYQEFENELNRITPDFMPDEYIREIKKYLDEAKKIFESLSE